MKRKNVDRRDFIKKAGILTLGLTAMDFPVWARSIFSHGYPQHNIPQDKGLDPKWIQSLFERGEPTTYLKSRNELRYIGMPVGGLHAGTVYIGGDGRLWLWQIYNETFEGAQEGIDPKTIDWNDGTSVRKIRSRDGSAYIEPTIADNKRILDQGFALKAVVNGKTYIKELNADHWDEVSFSASYPIASVIYSSKNFPLQVRLKAYAPFIPLNAEKSAIPATILRLEIINTSKQPIDSNIIGWMENGAGKYSGKAGTAVKVNEVAMTSGLKSIASSVQTSLGDMKNAGDNGTMCFTLHDTRSKVLTSFSPWPVSADDFATEVTGKATAEPPEKLVGGLSLSGTIAPGKSLKADFSISWHFNNVNPGLKKLVRDAENGYYYARRFNNAQAVSEFLITNFKELTKSTELWSHTWNDSTLPYWFLERTFVNIGTLATANTYRFASGRFWSWEGVGACAGTCTHVWQYAHAVARIFPELERDLRERVDLGTGFQEDSGAILFRGENENRPAIDGQAGTVLRFYREHQMSADATFLKKNWEKIKKATQFMLAQDKNGDGMTDTPMENTLDAVWEGEIAWIVGLCIAAARAAQSMAEEMSDTAFAGICSRYVENGRKNMERVLFNGEYFIHRPDPGEGRKKLGSYNTCHIDQVYGQAWAFQVGLPRILDKEKTLKALKALWKYNFTPDVGPYIKTHLGGRPYALAGEAGMVMNTNPYNEEKPFGENVTWQLGYFHECMSGFEHQVAAHLMAEDMVSESLILTRAVHERYDAAKRNPYNEIECSDHYARAMASYGTFITACGFEYHGPKGYIKFAPKWQKDNFRAPFTSATGWGSYAQKKTGNKQSHTLTLKYGSLQLQEIALESMDRNQLKLTAVKIEGRDVNARFYQDHHKLAVTFDQRTVISAGETMTITFST